MHEAWTSGPLGECLFRLGWEEAAFSDVTVQAFGRQYRAHKLLLCQSPFFRRMLQGPWREAGGHVLELSIDDPNVEPGAVADALKYLYGRPVPLDRGNVFRTLAVASYLGIDALANECVNFVCGAMDDTTVGQFYSMATVYDYGRPGDDIRGACLDFLRVHGGDERCLECLGALGGETLAKLLADDMLWLGSEWGRLELAWGACRAWREQREGERGRVGHKVEKQQDIQGPPLLSKWVGGSLQRCEKRGELGVHGDEMMQSEKGGLVGSAWGELGAEGVRFEHMAPGELETCRRTFGVGEDLIGALKHAERRREGLKQAVVAANGKRRGKAGSEISSPSNLRDFRIGVALVGAAQILRGSVDPPSRVGQSPALMSPEFFYAGSLWRVKVSQRRSGQGGVGYASLFVLRRPAGHDPIWGGFADRRNEVRAGIRVSVGWGPWRVERESAAVFGPDTWHSYGWPQFAKIEKLGRCISTGGELRVSLCIGLRFGEK